MTLRMANKIMKDKIKCHTPFILQTLKVSVHLRQRMFQAGLLTPHQQDELRVPIFIVNQRERYILQLSIL